MIKIISSLFILLAGLAIAASITYGVFTYKELKATEIRQQAIDQCLRNSSYTFSDDKLGITTVEPIENSVQKCLELKQLK